MLALDVSADQLARLADEVGCRVAVVDVTDDEAVAGVAALAPECRVLVNNAAIQRYRDLLHTTHEEMRLVLDVNLIGPVLMAQALVPVMAANGGGSIVNLSSITSVAHAGSTSLYPGVEGGGEPAHGGHGGGVRPDGRALQRRRAGHSAHRGDGRPLRPTRRRAAIAGCLPVSRMGAPEDIANAVSWLCSDEAVVDHRPGALRRRRLHRIAWSVLPLGTKGAEMTRPFRFAIQAFSATSSGPVGRPRAQGRGPAASRPCMWPTTCSVRVARSRARATGCRRSH